MTTMMPRKGTTRNDFDPGLVIQRFIVEMNGSDNTENERLRVIEEACNRIAMLERRIAEWEKWHADRPATKGEPDGR